MKLYRKLRKYDVVCFGGEIIGASFAKKFATLLRKDGVKVIYGGPHATACWKNYIQFFDVIVKGEGEITFNEVLNFLEKGRNLRKIRGIVFSEGKKVINTPERPLIQNIDILRFPERKIPFYKKYLYTNRFLNPVGMIDVSPVDYVITSRGCPFSCSFCYNFWEKYRVRSPEKVIEEIEFLIEKFHIKGIIFADACFTLGKKRTLELCKMLKKLDISWTCQTRIDLVDREILKKMKESGCARIGFGIESCSNETLKLMNKGINFQQVKRVIKICRDEEIPTTGFFMIGLPNEKRKDMIQTLKVSKKIGLNFVSWNRFIGLPQTKLYDILRKHNLIKFEYECGIVPNTLYVNSDEIEKILKQNLSLKTKIYQKIPLYMQKIINDVLLPPEVFFKIKSMIKFKTSPMHI
jgi:radical SAM superfamily enzyme YgiQ (UPF0313 family)